MWTHVVWQRKNVQLVIMYNAKLKLSVLSTSLQGLARGGGGCKCCHCPLTNEVLPFLPLPPPSAHLAFHHGFGEMRAALAPIPLRLLVLWTTAMTAFYVRPLHSLSPPLLSENCNPYEFSER